MALTKIGSVAGEAADAAVPQLSATRADTPDQLIDAIRRSLQPGDPIGRLLAAWPLTPTGAVPAARRPVTG